MNLEKLVSFSLAVVLAAALTGNLEKFTGQVQLATLKLIRESQTSHWGSPRFFERKTKNACFLDFDENGLVILSRILTAKARDKI
jgi:hypothetical protein